MRSTRAAVAWTAAENAPRRRERAFTLAARASDASARRVDAGQPRRHRSRGRPT